MIYCPLLQSRIVALAEGVVYFAADRTFDRRNTVCLAGKRIKVRRERDKNAPEGSEKVRYM